MADKPDGKEDVQQEIHSSSTVHSIGAGFEVNRVKGSEMRPASFSLRSNGWFTEGFDTADLREAKALLDELAS